MKKTLLFQKACRYHLPMTSAIFPTISFPNKKWLQAHVVQPYIEGAERLNRVWAERDFRSIRPIGFTLKERVISLLTGTLLLFPFFNAFFWKAWETFGNPEILSEPFCQKDL